MIPSLNALKTALHYLLLDRVDTHTAISTVEICEPNNKELIGQLKDSEHDLWQVCEMLMNMIKEREEINKPRDNNIRCVSSEDEMLTFHQSGKWLETLYASCPEQASDFLDMYEEHIFNTMDDARKLLIHFDSQWKSKYEEI